MRVALCWAVVWVIAGCGGDSQDRRVEPVQDRQVEPVAKEAPAPARSADAAAIDCDPYQRGLQGEVYALEVAADVGPHADKAHALVKSTPAACQDGLWHREAAKLLRQSAFPLETSAGTFESADAILARGLARDPKSPELLAYIAFLSSIDPASSPSLPGDACARARGSLSGDQAPDPKADRVRYICAHQAAQAGDHEKAAALLAQLHAARTFLDAQVLYAESLLALGNLAEAKKLARSALDHLAARARTTRISPRVIKALESRAKAVLRQAK